MLGHTYKCTVLTIRPSLCSRVSAFGRLAKRAGNPASQQQLRKVIAQLSQRTIELINQIYGRQIAAIGHAFAKLHVHHKALFNALIERAMLPHVITTFNSQDIGNLTWAFASLGVYALICVGHTDVMMSC